jgi:hypothetical protein
LTLGVMNFLLWVCRNRAIAKYLTSKLIPRVASA